MKPVVIIAIIFLSSFVVFDSFAQSSEESLGLSVRNMAVYILTAVVFLIIPVLIILLVIKRKGRLAGLTLKKSLGGIGLLFLGLMILGVAGEMSLSDEEIAKQRMEKQRKLVIEAHKEPLEQQDQKPATTSSAEFSPLGGKYANTDCKTLEDLFVEEIDYDALGEWLKRCPEGLSPSSPKIKPSFSGGLSDYCNALQDWISTYKGADWLTSEAEQEYNRLC